MTSPRIIAAVVGTKGDHRFWDETQQQLAAEVGAQLALEDCVVLTGGKGGVMAEAIRGAREQGGTTIALLPDAEHRAANLYADIVLPTGIGIARNVLTARMCHFMVALLGGNGTTEEMLFALDFKRPVFALPGAPVVEGARRIAEGQTSIDQILPALMHEVQQLLVKLRQF